MAIRIFFFLSFVLFLVGWGSPPPAVWAAAQPYEYISPRPGAAHIHPHTSLTLRPGGVLAPASIDADLFVIWGSQSGRHTGRPVLADDGETIVIYPDAPFAWGERVRVDVRPGLLRADGSEERVGGVRFEFATLAEPLPSPGSYLERLSLTPPFANPAAADWQGSAAHFFYTRPDLQQTMGVTILERAAGSQADGFLFVANMGNSATAPSLLIADDTGEPIYIKPLPAGLRAADFKKQIVQGQPYLTYHLGFAYQGWSTGSFIVLDDSYTEVDSWTIANGYGADLHEFLLLDNGHALLLGYVPSPSNLSAFGGPINGRILDIVIQEQDSGKNVIFEWRASEHLPLTGSYASLQDPYFDFLHTNAIEVDHDGHLLISNRHTSDIIKVHRQTGQVLWRLGGQYNQFTFTNDPGFYFPHDIRRQPNGHITLFDNGNLHDPPYSRAVEYVIDEVGKTATRVWQFPDDRSYDAPFMGSFQRLANGNSVMSWGPMGLVTEVTPGGEKALEMALGGWTYRAFRFDWNGLPAEPPRLAVLSSEDPRVATLFMSWNGATHADAFDVLAGYSEASLAAIKRVRRTGFESTTTLDSLAEDACVLVIRPVDRFGRPTPESAPHYRLRTPTCQALFPHQTFLPSIVK